MIIYFLNDSIILAFSSGVRDGDTGVVKDFAPTDCFTLDLSDKLSIILVFSSGVRDGDTGVVEDFSFSKTSDSCDDFKNQNKATAIIIIKIITIVIISFDDKLFLSMLVQL